MKVHYISEYGINEESFKRRISPACIVKMNYIISKLKEIGVEYEVLALSQTISPKVSFAKKDKRNKIRYRASIATKNKYFFYIDRFLAHLKLFFFLLSVKKDDIVLVYHERYYSKAIKLASKFKKFKLIYEVEEIYTIAKQCDQHSIDKEINNLTSKIKKNLKGYLFPTELLDNKLNTEKKPNIIIHGTYNVEKDYGEKFNDGKIHCVYAGTFDPKKGGAQAAVEAALHLSDKYHVHIIGFGSESEVRNVESQIKKVNELSKATVTYDGLKTGEEYLKFIQKCDIGLSTQNPSDAFNDTSFPSKILSYMANGLRVVSVRIPVVEQSLVGEYVNYYDKQNPKSIAEAIINVDLDDVYDGRKIIKCLDERFTTELKDLMLYV